MRWSVNFFFFGDDIHVDFALDFFSYCHTKGMGWKDHGWEVDSILGKKIKGRAGMIELSWNNRSYDDTKMKWKTSTNFTSWWSIDSSPTLFLFHYVQNPLHLSISRSITSNLVLITTAYPTEISNPRNESPRTRVSVEDDTSHATTISLKIQNYPQELLQSSTPIHRSASSLNMTPINFLRAQPLLACRDL